MGLSGACLNRKSLPDFATLNEIRQDLLAEGEVRKAVSTSLSRQRVPLVQQTVEKIVLDANRPVRLADIKPLAEEILGQPLQRTTMKSALAVLAQNESLVIRVSRGLYGSATTKR